MTLKLSEQSITLDGLEVVSDVGAAWSLSPSQPQRGMFLTGTAPETASRFWIKLGMLVGLERYCVCHRYEPYWMKPSVGSDLSKVPAETQFLLARLEQGAWLLVVPLIDEPLRFSLRGGPGGILEVLAETGDAKLPAQSGCALYLAAGNDPFEMMPECAKEVMARLGSGRPRREKPLADFVEQFGWCTWDAFYAEVSEEKVSEGLESFRAGGVEPKLLILDDGWLDVSRKPTGEKRLMSFEANHKFEKGLAPLVDRAKQQFGIQTFLVWHTIVGYWGGTDASLGYGVLDQVRHFGEGVLSHMPSFNDDWWGALVGTIPAEKIARFFDDFHRRLREQGVDGVKVDSQAVLEALAQGQGGRVRLSRAYRQALERSVQKHFDGRLINCMSNAQETWYCSPDSTLLRSSIDFFPNQPDSHGLHLHTNALVGLWFGEFMQPDWDMFQSGHPWGAFHAAGRALSGGPVYVSDRPGQQNFELLRKLVCADGSVLRADQPGLPTLDCLLADPCSEPVLLKIWNRVGGAAVVGVFNCHQAGGTHGVAPLEGSVGPGDVPGLEGQRFVAFRHEEQTLDLLDRFERCSVRLAASQFEIVTFVPASAEFVAVGLADKFNSRGAVEREVLRAGERYEARLRDGGAFLAYSKHAPRSLTVDGEPLDFQYDAASRRLSARVPVGGARELRIEW